MTEQKHIKTPLMEHFIEFRKRLWVSCVALMLAVMGCYVVIDEIYAFLVEPLANSFEQDQQRRLIYTSLTEAFFTYLRLAFYSGLFMAFPVIAWQGYAFLAPGLYRHEKKVLLPYLMLSPLLFVAGAALAYYFVFPLAWQFFVGFESSAQPGNLPIQLEAKVNEYLSLVIQIIFAFGLAFQLPVVLTMLVRVGMVQRTTLKRGRKYAVVAIITAAALLTPPDIISQVALFIPLYLLYELAIIVSAFGRHLGEGRDLGM